jgi:hypothetical protein
VLDEAKMLPALRHRYEETDQPMNALAAAFGIGVTTLQTLARKNGWSPRSQRLRECPPLMQWQDEAAALVASHDATAAHVAIPTHETAPTHVAAPTHETAPTVTLPLAGGASEDLLSGEGSALARIEALILKELAAEEARRNTLGTRPRPAYELERYARTLAVMTQTLERLQRLQPGSSGSKNDADDPIPDNMDEFRYELARRINRLIEGQIGRERMTLNEQMANLSDDEVKELIAVGRERGMKALLEPPQEKEKGQEKDNDRTDERLLGLK